MNAKKVFIDRVLISIEMAKKQITQKELSEIAEINQGNLSTMLKRGTVRPKTACRIAAALGVPVSEIIKSSKEK